MINLFLLFSLIVYDTENLPGNAPFINDDQPNIVFILVDDLAWNGLSSYRNEHVATPNIDRLADQGVKFTQAYVSPECLPTRVEFLSGQYSIRTGVTQVHHNRVYPFAPLDTPAMLNKLPSDYYTIANMLQEAGYATAISGKWHAGDNYRVANLKNNQGDEYFETYGFDFVGEASERGWSENITDYSEKDKEKANMDIIQDFRNFTEQYTKRPFFAFLSFFSPHTPIVAPDIISQQFVDKGYPKVTSLFGDVAEKPSADYLAMIKYLDISIGSLWDSINEMGILDNTMIVFMSDNGPLNRAWDSYPLRGEKGMLYEGGVRVPLIIHWPNKVSGGRSVETPAHIVDLYTTFKEVAGGKIPDGYTVDGLNLMSLMDKEDEVIREKAIYWHHPHYIHDYGKTPNSAIRDGDYKLIYYYGDYLDTTGQLPVRGKPYGELIIGERVELFNIKTDLYEKNDLSEEFPQKVEELLGKLKRKLEEMNTSLPQNNSNMDIDRWYEHTSRN